MLGGFVALVSLIISGGAFWLSLRADKRAASAERRAIEANDRTIAAEESEKRRQRRALFPRFILSDQPFNSLYERGIGNRVWSAAKVNVLSGYCRELPKAAPTGTPVALLVDAECKKVDKVSLYLEGKQIDFYPNVEIDGKPAWTPVCVCEYLYDPALFGRTQRIEVRMENEDIQQIDHYETEHGRRAFRRVGSAG